MGLCSDYETRDPDQIWANIQKNYGEDSSDGEEEEMEREVEEEEESEEDEDLPLVGIHVRYHTMPDGRPIMHVDPETEGESSFTRSRRHQRGFQSDCAFCQSSVMSYVPKSRDEQSGATTASPNSNSAATSRPTRASLYTPTQTYSSRPTPSSSSGSTWASSSGPTRASLSRLTRASSSRPTRTSSSRLARAYSSRLTRASSSRPIRASLSRSTCGSWSTPSWASWSSPNWAATDEEPTASATSTSSSSPAPSDDGIYNDNLGNLFEDLEIEDPDQNVEYTPEEDPLYSYRIRLSITFNDVPEN